VDFESGYTKNPSKIGENLKPLIPAGGVGIKIEDGEGAPELLARKIEKARKAAESAGVNLFINAGTDVYLKEIGSSESRAGEIIDRHWFWIHPCCRRNRERVETRSLKYPGKR
jgi:2-methylisocitrate lyase-like PEP mutase family enzyme